MPRSPGRSTRTRSADDGVVTLRTALDGLTIRDGLALLALLLIYRARWSAVRRFILVIGIVGGTVRAIAEVHML